MKCAERRITGLFLSWETKMKEKVSALLVGAFGYGSSYVKAIYKMGEACPVRLAGAADPRMQPSKTLELLREMQVPLYASMEDFFRENRADLCILSTPIFLHRQQLEAALAQGCHVLCEKPAAGSVEDTKAMAQMARESKKLVGIGFQMSYSEGILALKRDLLEGKLGEVLSGKSITFFPRPYSYFQGRSWAGKKFAPDGTPIWDSIANNAAAHSLHNMLFCLGEKMNQAARPVSCRGQLFRANAIETFDGVAAEFEIERNKKTTPFYYYGLHFSEETINPTFEIETEKGRVSYSMEEDMVRFTGRDGREKLYGKAKEHTSKLLKMAEAVAQYKMGKPTVCLCTPETALGHARAVELLNEMLPNVHIFKEADTTETLMKNEQPGLVVKGFDAYCRECYEKNEVADVEGWNRWKLRT